MAQRNLQYRDLALTYQRATTNSPCMGISGSRGRWQRPVKRLVETILTSTLIVLALPLMGLIALAIKLDTRGPILYRDRRHGLNENIFSVYKFRTLQHHKKAVAHFHQVTRNDPRVTKVGRFLRSTSLDELPQLFNVLFGTMSLVGPRPHPVELNRQFSPQLPDYHLRHIVKPGITGWAQINGWRGETQTLSKMRGRLACDLYYIYHWSLMFDLRILLKTTFVVWFQHRAY